MINLTPNVVNKPELQYLNLTSFHGVTSDNASSGLGEKCHTYEYLPLWCYNYGRTFGTIMKRVDVGEDTTWRAILTNEMLCPLVRESCVPREGKIWRGYHCRWRAGMSCSTSSTLCGIDTYQGSCLGEGHWL